MALNLVQVQTFLSLAREGNFTRTALHLDLTQPAVTQHIRGLQDHFAVKLVDVIGRRTVLTDAGRFLATRAEMLLGSVDALERDMREFADVRAGELRIGASVTIGSYQLPHILARFRADYPHIALHVEVANTDGITRAVEAGRISIALVEGPVVSDELDVDVYDHDRLVLIARVGHEISREGEGVRFEELRGVPIVFREEGSGTRSQVESAFEASGIVPNVVLALPTGEAIVRAVELGIGIGIVSALVVADAVAAGRVIPIPIRDVSFARMFRIVRLRRQTQSPAAKAFVAVVHASAGRVSQEPRGT